MVKVVVTDREGQVVEVEAQTGISLMENIRELDNSVDAICGGLCSCATCHIYVDSHWIQKLPPREEEEALLVGGSVNYDHEHSRLSCHGSLSYSSSEKDLIVLLCFLVKNGSRVQVKSKAL